MKSKKSRAAQSTIRKVKQSLRFRKLRRKQKKMLQKTVPVSSVLHSIKDRRDRALCVTGSHLG